MSYLLSSFYNDVSFIDFIVWCLYVSELNKFSRKEYSKPDTAIPFSVARMSNYLSWPSLIYLLSLLLISALIGIPVLCPPVDEMAECLPFLNYLTGYSGGSWPAYPLPLYVRRRDIWACNSQICCISFRLHHWFSASVCGRVVFDRLLDKMSFQPVCLDDMPFLHFLCSCFYLKDYLCILHISENQRNFRWRFIEPVTHWRLLQGMTAANVAAQPSSNKTSFSVRYKTLCLRE